MIYWNLFIQCVTATGVVFVMPTVVTAGSAEEAITKAVDHILKFGGQVTLMPGAPAVPVSIAFCTPLRVDKMDDGNRIVAANAMPTGRPS
jgi:hypothetical protein